MCESTHSTVFSLRLGRLSCLWEGASRISLSVDCADACTMQPPEFPCFAGTLEDTHASYHACADLLVESVKSAGAEVMIASHNERSIVHVADKMKQLGVPPQGAFQPLVGVDDCLGPREPTSPIWRGFGCSARM